MPRLVRGGVCAAGCVAVVHCSCCTAAVSLLLLQSRLLQPLSSAYFIEETGEMRVLSGVKKFLEPQTIEVEGLEPAVNSAAFSMLAWVKLQKEQVAAPVLSDDIIGSASVSRCLPVCLTACLPA